MRILVIVLCCLWSSVAVPEPLPGEMVAPECEAFLSNSKGKKHYSEIVMGYCLGVVDILLNLRVFEDQKMFCVPEHVTPAEVIAVIVEFIEANSEESQNRTFLVMSMAAIRQAWPCS